MAELTSTVDPDGTGDYVSLNAWNTGEAQDLTDGGGDNFVCTCISSSGSDDDVNCILTGWTTSETYDILIQAGANNEALKSSFEAARYVHGEYLEVREPWVTVDGLQWLGNAWSYNFKIAFCAAGTVTLKNSRFNMSESGCECVEIDESDIDFIMHNCIVHHTANTADHAIQIINTNSALIYNNIAEGMTTGLLIAANGNGVTAKNNAFFTCTDDINDGDNSTLDYNATDDGDGGNAIAPSGADWDNEFVDSANGDFTLVASGNCDGGGVGPGTDANVPTTDMEGDARAGATCDVGVDETAAAGGVAPTSTIFGPLYGPFRGVL